MEQLDGRETRSAIAFPSHIGRERESYQATGNLKGRQDIWVPQTKESWGQNHSGDLLGLAYPAFPNVPHSVARSVLAADGGGEIRSVSGSGVAFTRQLSRTISPRCAPKELLRRINPAEQQ